MPKKNWPTEQKLTEITSYTRYVWLKMLEFYFLQISFLMWLIKYLSICLFYLFKLLAVYPVPNLWTLLKHLMPKNADRPPQKAATNVKSSVTWTKRTSLSVSKPYTPDAQLSSSGWLSPTAARCECNVSHSLHHPYTTFHSTCSV